MISIGVQAVCKRITIINYSSIPILNRNLEGLHNLMINLKTIMNFKILLIILTSLKNNFRIWIWILNIKG